MRTVSRNETLSKVRSTHVPIKRGSNAFNLVV